MAVYHMHFNALCTEVRSPVVYNSKEWAPRVGRKYANNHFEFLQRFLKETKNWCVFIITKSQMPIWEKMLKDYDMEQYIKFQMPDFVTNSIHDSAGRQMKLFILRGKGDKE